MNRVIVLDLLRFFAALSVVLYHYTFDGIHKVPATSMQFQELGSIFKYGQLGVELFFMISGFVILLSIENKTISHFIISRISRLYPAYWVGVSLTALIVVLFGEKIFDVSLRQYFFNLTMIQEWFAVRNIDGVYWTLFVELRFYFLIFILMLFKQVRYLKYYLLGWAFLSLSYWFYPINAYLNYYLISNVAPFFIAGAIFYGAYRDEKFTGMDYLILFLSFVSALFYLEQKKSGLDIAFNTEMSMAVFVGILSFYFALFYVISTKVFTITKEKRLFTMMGATTYPLYLIHAYIGYVIFIHFHSYFNKYVLLAMTIVLMLIIAYLIHITIEKQFGKWMRNRMFRFVDKLLMSKKK